MWAARIVGVFSQRNPRMINAGATAYFQLTSDFGLITGWVSDKKLIRLAINADFEPEGPSLSAGESKPFVAAIRAVLKGEQPQWLPELAPVGSEFQQRVWQGLLQIPKGKVWSYADLAVHIGASPTASRAVGTACGANPIALLIPCHRVVRKDGGLGGFAWGLPLKRHLLACEGVELSRDL